MTRMKRHRFGVLLMMIVLNSGFLSAARANPSEFAFRVGPLFENSNHPISSNKLVATTLELEYSLYRSNVKALVFRYTLANDFASGKTYYSGVAVGPRYFFDSQAYRSDTNDNGIHLEIVPDWRYFWGFDFGVSQILVTNAGSSLQTTNTDLTASASIGITRQIADEWNVQGILGLGTGYGLSSLKVLEFTARALVGVGYQF
jgi:hypothetical protein